MFDFDGTIVDTSEALFKAYSKAFKSACSIELDRTVWNGLFGENIAKICEILGVKDKVADVQKLKKEIYPKDFYSDMKLIKFSRDHYTKPDTFNIICTNTTKDVVEQICKHFNVWGYFDDVYDRTSVQYRKPDPEMFIKVRMEYDLIVEDKSYIFEDSDVGINAAKLFRNIFPGTVIYKVEGDSGYPII